MKLKEIDSDSTAIKNEIAEAIQFSSLTRRELELVDILKTGVSNKAAAEVLNVTYFTINQHLKNIYKKLNINSKNMLITMDRINKQ